MGNLQFNLGRFAKTALRVALVGAPLAALAPVSASACCGGTFTAAERVSEAGQTITKSVWSSNGEQVTQLLNNANYVPVLTVTLPTVSAGQVISFTADMQATNNYTTVDPTLSTYVAINGTPADLAQGTNVTPAQHHFNPTRAGTWQAGSNLSNVVIQLMARASDTQLGSNVQGLSVDQGYGVLLVKLGY
jgi:hypothetical protein